MEDNVPRKEFKSKNTPPPCHELERFESDLLDLFASIKFRDHLDQFQRKLKEDVNKQNI